MRVVAESLCEPIAIRRATPADAPALGETIATIDEETEFLGAPGEYRRRWADGLVERLRAGAENGSGGYVMALRDAEIVGFLGAFAGLFARTRGAYRERRLRRRQGAHRGISPQGNQRGPHVRRDQDPTRFVLGDGR